MGSFVQERPLAPMMPARNEIRYVLGVTNPTRTDNVVNLNLRWRPCGDTSSGEILANLELTPDADGLVYAYVHELLAEVLQPVLPDPEALGIIPAAAQAVEYWIEHRNINRWILDNTTAQPFLRGERDYIKTALLAGVHHEMVQSDNFYSNFIQAKRFMTWQDPAGVKIAPDVRSWLAYVHLLENTEPFKLLVQVYDIDGSQHQFEIPLSDNQPLLDSCKVWHVPVSPLLLGIDCSSQQVHYYELSILKWDNEELVQPYRFYIDYTPQYDCTDLVFFTSLGSWQAIRVAGVVERGYERDARDIGRTLFDKAWNTRTKNGDMAQLNHQRRDVFKGDVGFQDTPQEQELLMDLLTSQHVYTWQAGRWVQVIITNKNGTLRTNDDGTWSMPLEWRLSFTQKALMPMAASLGDGQDPTLSPTGPRDLPTGLVWTDQGAGVAPATRTIRFAWTNSGDPKRRLRYRNIDTAEWTYSELVNTSTLYIEVELENTNYYQAELQGGVNDDNMSQFVRYSPEIAI